MKRLHTYISLPTNKENNGFVNNYRINIISPFHSGCLMKYGKDDRNE